MLTGVILAGANVVYSVVRNPTDLVIPIGTDHVLMFSWGWCYWVNVATGMLSYLQTLLHEKNVSNRNLFGVFTLKI